MRTSKIVSPKKQKLRGRPCINPDSPADSHRLGLEISKWADRWPYRLHDRLPGGEGMSMYICTHPTGTTQSNKSRTDE